ncbi:response regulator [Novosphingobium profundi]|uniref:response regulator n=1 Tax=Novosphingobium profundi TaxID=1774954 RepID=UPI001BDAEEE3|nr:response regulator [Novosphingobium profundi]MBT0666938.1 response regulator [Novosphingobium profundi]
MLECAEGLDDFTVLIVDDDDVALEGVLRSFKRNEVRCQTLTASDGREALAILNGVHPSKHISPPYIVLLDLNMPGMDGFQFLHALRTTPELKRTVVFILSTSAREQDMCRAYDEQVAGYMVKSAVGPQFARLADFIRKYTCTQKLPRERS